MSEEDTRFELWIQRTYDHSSILHDPEKIFVYVNEHWQDGPDEWRAQAIRRFGCAMRMEYAGELLPPYQVEILVSVPKKGGQLVTETVAAGNIDGEYCTLYDFFPIKSATKETSL